MHFDLVVDKFHVQAGILISWNVSSTSRQTGFLLIHFDLVESKFNLQADRIFFV